MRYLRQLGAFNRNCNLLFLASSLNGLSQGIFLVVFNLYILSIGMDAGTLGVILSASPFAQALGSIPIGFLMEIVGYRKVLLLIYGVAGLAKLAQVATGNVFVIATAAFISGLALSGDFVVRLPFLAANTTPEEHSRVYSVSSVFFAVSTSMGMLFAGYIPNLFQMIGVADLSMAYRGTLYLAGILSLAAALPCLLITEQAPVAQTRKISLAPYLWGMDRFTVQQAVVSGFVGIGLGLTNPFMNLYFIYHLGTTREFFSAVSALSVIPALIATAVGPLIAAYLGMVRAVTWLRAAVPLFLTELALSTNPWLGTISYWGHSALSNTSQPLSFAFAMRAATQRAKSAASAWLNVTFWLGQAIAAPIAGAFLAHSNYWLPLMVAGLSILVAGVCNQLFFAPLEKALNTREAQPQVVREVELG